MTDPESKLAALWAIDAAPAYDPGFQIAVLAQVERERLFGQLVRLVFIAVLTMLSLWATWPMLASVGAELFSALPIATPLVLGLAAAGLTVFATVRALATVEEV